MEMEDAVSTGLDTLLDHSLLNIHVKGIRQETHVLRPNPIQEIQTFRQIVDQRRFIATDRLQGDPHTLGLGSGTALLQGLDQPGHGLLLAHTRLDDATQETNNDHGSRLRGKRNVGDGALDGSFANSRIGIGEGQAFLPPRLTGPNGRDLESVSPDDLYELVRIHELWIADGQLHSFVSQTGNLGHIAFEITLEGNSLELGRMGG